MLQAFYKWEICSHWVRRVCAPDSHTATHPHTTNKSRHASTHTYAHAHLAHTRAAHPVSPTQHTHTNCFYSPRDSTRIERNFQEEEEIAGDGFIDPSVPAPPAVRRHNHRASADPGSGWGGAPRGSQDRSSLRAAAAIWGGFKDPHYQGACSWVATGLASVPC